MASTTGRRDYSEIQMRKTTFSVLACSVNVVSSESNHPMQAIITTSNTAIISTVRDLVEVGFITTEDLLSLVVEQVRNCDAISLRHVLPNAVLNELITTHKSISKEL